MMSGIYFHILQSLKKGEGEIQHTALYFLNVLLIIA